MHKPGRVLQNVGGEHPQPGMPLRLREPERLLSPFEADALLTASGRFTQRNRVLPDFQDNYSGDFHLFRIY
ncbi:MAG TPA: hypothetical protein VIH25_11355 [Steroidobacteraceae bacterium]